MSRFATSDFGKMDEANWQRMMQDVESGEKRLKEPSNVREITPRVCAVCHFFRQASGVGACIRPNSPKFDTGDGWQWMTTCDRFKATDYNE